MAYEDPEKRKAYNAAWYAKNSEKKKAYNAALYAKNPEKVKACNAAWRAKNSEKVKAYSATYRAKHREEIKARRVKHREETKAYRLEQRETELVVIVQVHRDVVPQCQAYLTPKLLDIPCRGALQIDHINGGGRKDNRNRMRMVLNGSRDLDDLRILCELHQQYYAILRGDSLGGSSPGDWVDAKAE